MIPIFQLTILLSCFLASIISPSNDEASNFNQKEFKRYFFRSCIEYGYEGDPCIKSILSQDTSPLSDFPLGLVGYETADSLAHEVRKEIVDDSLKLYTRVDFEIGKKRVLLICMKHYESAELDSIAKSLFSSED